MTVVAEADDTCLICGERSLRPLISIQDVPTLCNRLCQSKFEAANASRGQIQLSYCNDCGHIANCGFDEARVHYDGRFENTLTFSSRYRQYAEALADRVVSRYGLIGKNVVEIGCGRGEFLRLLCSPGNHGEGYDPSQSTSRSMAGLGSVEIIGRNFSVEDARGADLVCCRHVLEHLPKPMDLLRQLRESIAIKADAAICFEVPNGLFTLERLGIWDIIHEHVSYFTSSSMARAFEAAGFTISCVETTFDDQNLWLEARVGEQPWTSGLPKRPPKGLYSSFPKQFAEKIAQWRQLIYGFRSEGRQIAIWGAGAKGVMFLNLLGIAAGAGIDWVVDINPRKQGHFVPLMGQEIICPERLLQNPPDLVVVMNPEYEHEIRTEIERIGLRCEVASA